MITNSVPWAARTIFCLLAPVIVSSIAGCSIPIAARYTPVGATESLVMGNAKLHLFVGRFEDARTDKESIGDMNNLFGGSVKKITTSEDLGLLFAEAATDALRKSGAEASLHGERVATAAIPTEEFKGADYVIGGRFKTVHVESQPGWDTIKITARVIIDVYVKRDDKGEWIGPIEGTAETREIVLQTEALTHALDIAIGNSMKNMIRHLKSSGALVSKEP